MVLKHIVSVDGAVSDHALAMQLVVSSKVISLQIPETLSALSTLYAIGQSNNNLTPNREKKKEDKTTKYGPLRWELKQNYLGYEVKPRLKRRVERIVRK